MTNEAKRPALGKPISVLRDELLADEETRQTAKILGLTIGAYVDQVIDFVINPDKKPEIVLDNDAPERPRVWPTDAEMKALFRSEERVEAPPALIADPGLVRAAPPLGARRGEIRVAMTLEGQDLKARLQYERSRNTRAPHAAAPRR